MALEPAVRVENLGKCYQITSEHPDYTLRDKIASSFQALLNQGRSILSGATRSQHKDELWALHNVSFEIKRGEVVGIVGPNGSGKSTLLKILSRITPPSAGRAEVNGRLGCLLEVGTGFHPDLTGGENIYLTGAILGMKRREIEKRFHHIAAFAGVERFLDTPVKWYSSGMGLRLAFSVAAHLSPDILVVDEVLAVGDIAFQKKCLQKVEENSRQARTVLLVSHNLGIVRRFCTRVLCLSAGHIIFDGDVETGLLQYQQLGIGRDLVNGGRFERPTTGARPAGSWLSAVELRNAQGNLAVRFNCNDSLDILIHISGETAPMARFISWFISDAEGTPVAWSNSYLTGGVSLDQGKDKLLCHIFKLGLARGRYVVSLAFGNSALGQPADYWRDAAYFEVVHCDPYSTGSQHHAQPYGAALLEHRWQNL